MFSLAHRVCRWQLYSTLILLPSRVLVRILGTILWFLGIQKGKTSVERVIESCRDIPARTDVSSILCCPLFPRSSSCKTHSQGTVSIEEATTVISNRTSGPVVYSPTVEKVLNYGSTSVIGRLKAGVVLKSPRYSWWSSPAAEAYDSVKHIRHSFSVEEQILGILGEHPRIIKYRLS